MQNKYYSYRDGHKVFYEEQKPIYLVQHIFMPTINNVGQLTFKMSEVSPVPGVAITSLTDKRYVILPHGGIKRVFKDGENIL